MARQPVKIASWIAYPLLVFGTLGAFFIFERETNRPDAPVTSDPVYQKLASLQEGVNAKRRWDQTRLQLQELPLDQRTNGIDLLLTEAVQAGEAEGARALLAMAPANERDRWSPLVTSAVNAGDIRMARVLLEGGVPVPTPRLLGSKPRPMRALIATVDESTVPPVPVPGPASALPLLDAIAIRSADAVRLLVQHGADADTPINLHPLVIRALVRGRKPGQELMVSAPADGSAQAMAMQSITPREIARRTGDPVLLQAMKIGS